MDSKVYWFLYACGIPFNVLRSPYWHEMVEAICTAPTGYKSLGDNKARIVGLDKEKAKIQNALGQFTQMLGMSMGYHLYQMVGPM